MELRTYNIIIDRLAAFASGHYQIGRFTHGRASQIDNIVDPTYPIMHVEPIDVRPELGQITYSFSITFADLPRDKSTPDEYRREIVSDMILLATDLLSEIRNGNVLFGDEVDVATTPTITPFFDEFANTLSGVTLSIDIIVPYDWSACDIPADYSVGGSGGTGGSGSSDSILLQVNGVDNAVQSVLNLVQGSNIVITDNGDGSVTIRATGGGGGGLTCDDLADCQTIIDIVEDIEADKEDIGNLQTAVGSLQTAVGVAETDIDNLQTVTTSLGAAVNDRELLANKDTDPTLAANSNTLYPSQKAVKGYVDTGLSGKANTVHTHVIADVTDVTTVGANVAKLTNPSAVTFLRVNADNTVTALSASDMITALGMRDSYVFGSGGVFNPADNLTYYVGSSQTMVAAPSSTPARRRVYVGSARRITGVDIQVFTTVTGSGEDVAISVRVNNTTDYVVGNMQWNPGANSYAILNNQALDITLAADDYYEIKIVCPTWAPNPTGVTTQGSVTYQY